jgi:hypothetical protein
MFVYIGYKTIDVIMVFSFIITHPMIAHGLTSSPSHTHTTVPDQTYNLAELAALVGVPGGLVIGAGAGSSKVAGVNCEMMPNARVPHNSDPGLNNTHIAKVSTEDGSCVLERFPSLETGPLANVLVSEGKPGKVLEVKAKKRTGQDNFVSVMRKKVGERYGEKPVAFGGAFHITAGKAKLHVMPDFSDEPLTSDDAVNKWLRFYDMSSPLTCLSEFISHDPGLDLRVEHTHCYSDHGEGGHYHCDVTPDHVEYHGYYTVAEKLFRIDQPKDTHTWGRD